MATAIIAISAPFITNNFASEKDSSESDSLTEEDVTNSDLGVLPSEEPNQEGSIVVEAGDGVLGGDIFLSYIGESARGCLLYTSISRVTKKNNVV